MGLCQRLFENPIISGIPFIHTPTDHLTSLQVIEAELLFIEDTPVLSQQNLTYMCVTRGFALHNKLLEGLDVGLGGLQLPQPPVRPFWG